VQPVALSVKGFHPVSLQSESNANKVPARKSGGNSGRASYSTENKVSTFLELGKGYCEPDPKSLLNPKLFDFAIQRGEADIEKLSGLFAILIDLIQDS
jgi:hypothetical protein